MLSRYVPLSVLLVVDVFRSDDGPIYWEHISQDFYVEVCFDIISVMCCYYCFDHCVVIIISKFVIIFDFFVLFFR